MKSWRTEMTIWTDLAGIGFRLDYVDAGGTRTRALIAGEGQDIIALHGTSGHLEAFSRNIVPHVRAGYRIHAIDALGHGYTDKPNEHYEVFKYGYHVLPYMDAQGIAQAPMMGELPVGCTSVPHAINPTERLRTIQLIAPSVPHQLPPS